MTTAWTSSGSVSGSNKNHLMTRQTGFVGNHPLELLKRPAVELRTLLSTAPLAAVSDTAEVFQHNQAIRGKTIDEAATNGMQVVACPTAFLIAQPCPSFFRSRAFALQDTPSGTEPLAPLYRLHTRNLDTVRSNKQVNFAEVNPNNSLWGFTRFGDWNGDSDVQIEFTVPMTLENGRSRVGRSEDRQVALPDFDSALDPFTVTSSDADPDFIVFPEQAEEVCVQVQRLGLEGQEFRGLLLCFESFVRFCDTLASADGIISKEVEPLSDVVVSSMMKSDGMEASLVERYLTDSVTSVCENIQHPFQPLLIFYRQVKFRNNGQFHRLYYTINFRTCQVPSMLALYVPLHGLREQMITT